MAVALHDKPAMLRICLLAIALALAGCVVHAQPRHHSSRASRVKCKPSHHWNGRYCEHNGRGRGARKHDYHH